MRRSLLAVMALAATAACRPAATPPAGALPPLDRAAALATAERDCGSGDAGACDAAGAAYFKKHPERSLEYRQKACDLGSGEGCLGAALLEHEKGGTQADRRIAALHQKARDLFGRDCAAGDPHGCYELAGLVRMDDETKGQVIYAQAAARWGKQCEAGDAHACYRLGIMYGEETGVRYDFARSQRIFDDACRRGILEACAALGHLLKDSPTRSDDARAAQLFEEACTAGIERRMPCREGGFMLAEGDGVAADKPRAALLLEAGCNQGDELCCFKLGAMLHEGDGVPRDLEKSAALLNTSEGLDFRVVDLTRSRTAIDPGLRDVHAEGASTPIVAAPGEELVLAAVEIRRRRESARLPVRKLYLVDRSGRLFESHASADTPFGDQAFERRRYLFRVPVGMQPVQLKLELGAVVMPVEKKT